MRLRWLAVLAIAGCGAPFTDDSSADVLMIERPTLGVSLPSNWVIDVDASWPARDDATAYRVRVRVDVVEDDRVIDEVFSTEAFVEAAAWQRAVEVNTAILGDKAHDDLTLRWMDVSLDISACADERCDDELERYDRVTRTVSWQVRPFPRAELELLGGVDHNGLAKSALKRLNGMIDQCDNAIITVNGTMYEGDPGTNAMGNFMKDRGYDCVVSVSYHDGSGGWGDVADADTWKFCQSAELGADSLQAVWGAAVRDSNLKRWDVLGHSKGAAAAVKFYGREPTGAWPGARFYTIGLPWRMAGEYLPTPHEYQRGRIYAHGQLVAFTWTNDGVGDIDSCIDIDALSAFDKHDYGPFMRNDRARMAFAAGERVYIGSRDEYE